jgi:cholesterol 24(S)-hydroxylase
VIRNLRKFAREKILNRIKDIENGEHVPNDILTIIINTCSIGLCFFQQKLVIIFNKQDEKNFLILKEHDKLDLEELIDDFITFFNAGQETTANTLAFAFLELGRTPDALRKLKDEIDREMGARSQVNYEDMNKLEYTNCVFKETLRLWPPAPIMSRVTDRDFLINNYKIPPNTQLTISPHLNGRSAEYFPDPDKFKPERFLKENQLNEEFKYKQKSSYLGYDLAILKCFMTFLFKCQELHVFSI